MGTMRQELTKLRDNLNNNNTRNMGVDGVSHINMGEDATTELGKLLYPANHVHVNHVFGYFYNMDVFLNAIRTANFPREFRDKYTGGKINKKLNSPKFRKLRIPNYYAILVEAYWMMIMDNNDLLHSLKESVLPIYSYSVDKKSMRSMLDSSKVSVCKHRWMNRQISTIMSIRSILQNKTPYEHKDAIVKLMMDTMEKPELDLYHGVPYAKELIICDDTEDSFVDSGETLSEEDTGDKSTEGKSFVYNANETIVPDQVTEDQVTEEPNETT